MSLSPKIRSIIKNGAEIHVTVSFSIENTSEIKPVIVDQM